MTPQHAQGRSPTPIKTHLQELLPDSTHRSRRAIQQLRLLLCQLPCLRHVALQLRQAAGQP
jgi:hypothetical protein